MDRPEPNYSPENCKFAYQLRWGVTIHWLHPIDESVWLKPLQTELEKDEIRILSWRWLNPLSTQFALSTLPSASPLFIIQRLKGRLQYAVRDHHPKALEPHYAIRSFGTQEREIIEAYIAKQPTKHRMADERVQKLFEELVYIDTSEANADSGIADSREAGLSCKPLFDFSRSFACCVGL